MIPLALVGAGTVAGAALIAWLATTLIVEVCDRLGLCYSASREQRRHRHDTIPEPVPARRLVPVMATVLDFDDPAVRQAIDAPPVNRTPLADRIERARRLALTA